jgi:hypothetical protein
VDVDPAKNMRDFAVKHGAGDALLIFGHDRMGAGTWFLRIAVIATRAGVYTIEQFFLALSKAEG